MKFLSGLVVALCVLCALLGVWWQTPYSLKIRVAVDLMGWDGFLAIVKDTMAQRLLGKRRTKSRNAWHRMVKALGDSELQYLVPQRRVNDPETIAEGHRFMVHLLKFATDIFDYDLDRPHFEPMVHPRKKMLGDNPDARYLNAYINKHGSYVVRGRKTREVYLSFTIYEAPCIGCFSSRVVADMNHLQLQLESDGSFVLHVSPTKPDKAKNWLSLANAGKNAFPQLITRHYFEQAMPGQMDPTIHIELSIEPLVSPGLPPPKGPTTDADIAERLERIEHFVSSHTVGMTQDPADAPSWFSFVPNTFGAPNISRNENNGELVAVDIAYSAAPWKFDPNTQGLEISGVMPDCIFANVVLWNVFLQTLPYETGRQVSLNRKQMKSLDSKGNFKILLSKFRPADLPANVDWLDCEERAMGTVFFRFMLPKGDVVTPSARVVQIST